VVGAAVALGDDVTDVLVGIEGQSGALPELAELGLAHEILCAYLSLWDGRAKIKGYRQTFGIQAQNCW